MIIAMKENRNENPQQQSSNGCPYVGLMPFTEKDTEYFFGRTSDIENVATNLRACSLTVFYGGSGVGKSSLLNAGVIPYLQKIAEHSVLPGKPTDFIPVVLREWANNPVDELKLCINGAVEKAVKGNMITHLAMSEVNNMARDSKENNDLSDLLKAWTDLIKTDLLIILDQFEDVFLHPEFITGKGSFGEEFPRAANNRNLPVNFILSLRADAIDKLDFFKGKIPNLMKNTLRLLPLDREATREAICEPLRKYNEKMQTTFRIEGDSPEDDQIKNNLVEKLLDDLRVDKIKLDTQGQANLTSFQSAATEPAATTAMTPAAAYQVETPYLQLVMVRLWEYEDTQRTKLFSLETLESKEKLGGVENIVKTHLDEVMAQFNEKEKELAAEFIHFTITRSGTKISLNATDLMGLAELEEDRQEEVTQILRRLSKGDNSIFKVVPNRREPANPFYEVTHDALGPAILNWRKRENDAKRQRQALEKEKEKRRKELAEIERKRQVERAEQEVKLKEEQERLYHQKELFSLERKKRALGRIIYVLVILFLGAAIALGFYYIRYKESDKEREFTKQQIKIMADERYAFKLSEAEKDVIQSYESELTSYKSLIDILTNLQSGKPDKIKISMSQLEQKAKDNDLPDEYKPLIIEILQNAKVSPQSAEQKKATIQTIYNSQGKSIKPTSMTRIIIFIHVQQDDPNAKKLKDLLQKNKFIAPGVENVGLQPGIKNRELRYFRDDASETAEYICNFLKDNGIDGVKPTPIKGYENSPLVRPNQFELWFTADPLPDIP
jgi:preprotein translocase subunit SecG